MLPFLARRWRSAASTSCAHASTIPGFATAAAAWPLADRLEEVTQRARSIEVPHVLCHLDFGGLNLLLDHDGVAAILDWDQACLAPREHDVWIAAEGAHGREFLEEYGADDLDLTHLEYALLARALRDMAARVCEEVDRPGVDTWGFARLARLETDLEMFRPFCRAGRPRSS